MSETLVPLKPLEWNNRLPELKMSAFLSNKHPASIYTVILIALINE
jgi:hypothetical protein